MNIVFCSNPNLIMELGYKISNKFFEALFLTQNKVKFFRGYKVGCGVLGTFTIAAIGWIGIAIRRGRQRVGRVQNQRRIMLQRST